MDRWMDGWMEVYGLYHDNRIYQRRVSCLIVCEDADNRRDYYYYYNLRVNLVVEWLLCRETEAKRTKL